MSNSTIQAGLLTRMFLNGAQNLASSKEWINELNVFPVPDGDTGTNMTMTVVSAVREVTSVSDPDDMKAVCKAISSGSLRGARGNSGVILSQLFRGACKVVRDCPEIDVPLAATAFEKAVETAYKAVMKPKEGTILTVARGISEKARELSDAGIRDFDEFLPQLISEAEAVLATTPDLLPVLKQAGVVDSGGQGLVQVLKGFYEGLCGKEADVERLLNPETQASQEGAEDAAEAPVRVAEALKYIYATDFIILLNKTFTQKTETDFKAYLKNIGDQIELAREEGAVKVRVNTNDPGLIIQRALLYGQLVNIRVENRKLPDMQAPSEDQKETSVQDDAEDVSGEHKSMGIIAVAAGEGLGEIFRGLGVDCVISGGQTMNPSTDDILKAVDHVNADTVFILPNNKNIIMAAQQAAAMDHEKQLIVIPTKTIPQGITAVINFMPDQSAEANRENMEQEMSRVRSAEVTYAVRDTLIDDVEIRQGNMMAIGDDGILAVGEEKNETSAAAIAKIVDDSTEMISIYYGSETSEEDAQVLRDRLAGQFPSCEVELQYGGQPVYYYILSAE